MPGASARTPPNVGQRHPPRGCPPQGKPGTLGAVTTAASADYTGWAAPTGSLVLGLLALPLMFVGPTSFVLSLTVATAASLSGLVVVTGSRPTPQRVVGAVGALTLPLLLACLAIPFVLQN